MTLSIFNDICGCWWLYWILPFLLGLLLGWLIWARYRRYKAMYEKKTSDLNAANKRIAKLEEDLKKCRAGRADFESQISSLKGQLREARGRVTKSENTKKFSNQKHTPKAPPAPVVTNSIAATPVAVPTPAPASNTGAISDDKFAALKADNLQVVEGIGPKMDEVLKSKGVNTWSALAAKTPADLKGILGTYGDKYRIIDPSSWSAQAKLASTAKWMDLIDMQKQLDSGKSGKPGLTDSKVEKIMIKLKILKRWKQDDLKAVEGIGPKIESLLHDDGIKTWKALSEANTSRLQKILDDAGKRFKLADPGTWPKQAGLAHQGKWDELEELQDVLNGGR